MLREFVQTRQNAAPVETYDELQDVPGALANFVRATGEDVTRYRRPAIEYAGKIGALRTITAMLTDPGESNERVTLTTWQPTLPFLRRDRTKLLSMGRSDPTWDYAGTYRGKRESYFPHSSSPQFVDFWNNLGDQPLYAPEPGRSITAAGMAREGRESAAENFNGYLSMAVLLVDKLTQATPKQ